MLTYGELKNFIEKFNITHELNPIYHEYEYPGFDENGKFGMQKGRYLFGYELGMNNISGRNGKSEWQWVWYEFHLIKSDAKEGDGIDDDELAMFTQRYSMVNGKSYRGFSEEFRIQDTIRRRMSH